MDDVARAIARAIECPTVGGVVNVCGPDEVTWKELLLAVAQSSSAGRRKIPLRIPQPLLLLAGWIGERLPTPLLSRDAVIFATQFDQSCRDGAGCAEAFGFQPIRLREGLRMTFARRG